jgi:hypothetical protein
MELFQNTLSNIKVTEIIMIPTIFSIHDNILVDFSIYYLFSFKNRNSILYNIVI